MCRWRISRAGAFTIRAAPSGGATNWGKEDAPRAPSWRNSRSPQVGGVATMPRNWPPSITSAACPVLQFLHSGYRGSGYLQKRNRRPGLSRSEAAHLDRLLDEALRETFPASDPIAITVEKSPKGVELGPDEPESPSMPADSQDAAVIWAP